MYTAAKRRVREAEKRVERLEFKFISEYVKVLHGDIHKKAEDLYKSIRQKYPDGVKDLTKTVEYMNAVTPPPPAVSSPPPVVSSPPPVVSSPPPVVSSPPPVVSSPPPVVSSPPPVVSSPTPLPLLSEEVFHQLLQDLQQDPDLAKILNDFPLDDSIMDTGDLHHDIWDSIIPEDMSSLEQELESVFM